MKTILSAEYVNGRWGNNIATVMMHDDGHYTFCNGYGDPWFCQSYEQAKIMFHEFLADRKPERRPYN